jgi:hypothetical protein
LRLVSRENTIDPAMNAESIKEYIIENSRSMNFGAFTMDAKECAGIK